MKREIKYKLIKVHMPHCNVCGEQLRGNGSVIIPYRCKCGEWEWDFVNSNYKVN